jgi:16S rRNA (adenine1518-N6/adenine1519-N6)-dimethyltransferase
MSLTAAEECKNPPASTRMFTRPSVIRDWLQAASIRPNRILGQNFLIDGNVLDIMLETAEVGAHDRILEVGPGAGALTAALLARGARVTAIEKDSRLLPFLREKLPAQKNLRLVEGDALDLVDRLLQAGKINKFVANLPYTPGTRILVDVVTLPARPEMIAVMVQDEVAMRITADPGNHSFGLLGLWCRCYYDVAYIKRVNPTCFWPRPQVKSAIVKLTRKKKPGVPEEGWPFFQGLTRRIFQQRRKQMGHLLAKLFTDETGQLSARDFLPECYHHDRPEALPLDVWCALSENMRMKSNWNIPLSKSEGEGQDGW